MSVPLLTRRGFGRASAFAALSAIAGFVVGRNSAAANAKPGAAANAYGAISGHAAQVLTTLDAIPADGKVVDGVVLTRDSAGSVHGVSATCTHQGCTVGSPKNGTVTCPCHGSQFNAATGAVLRGPATQPLPSVAVAVQGNQVVRS